MKTVTIVTRMRGMDKSFQNSKSIKVTTNLNDSKINLEMTGKQARKKRQKFRKKQIKKMEKMGMSPQELIKQKNKR